MNRIEKKLKEEKKILSIYFTAGFPNLNDTQKIISILEKYDVDLIEVGIPFSDPLADGETIQKSSKKAIENGMTINTLFYQLKDLRNKVKIPVILMGYLNPIMQFGIEKFCVKSKEIGIDGLIIPDLPVEIYIEEYKSLFNKNNLLNIFLITPETSEERIKLIDKNSKGFIYMVSSSSITGSKKNLEDNSFKYFDKISNMNLNNPSIVGFGISNRETYEKVIEKSKGAIIGSAFINFIEQNGIKYIGKFIKKFR
ncbi:MAG: tryptophan synthase subunit alpha [Flavobacteriales bacterium TMED96]|nr:MAG: tryptophan synthase subunit alpha [Flavobacteriales bacterium TMED96]|tara:strand:- start:7071 stop:7832 length:762 start_codon:yes stop_codon:yes gene_type:complete